MMIINTLEEFKLYRNSLTDKHIGFIPTMGALHLGHLSLVEQSLLSNQKTLVSIFVNPTQFDNKKDLNNYPNLLQEDLEKLKHVGVDCVFLPSFKDLYPDDYSFQVQEKQLSKKYCGAHRNGHFDGVLTVVMKLLNIVQPTKAYFGEKDYQQLHLIKRMVDTFFMPITIIAGTTIRENDGLAMSSRNLNLTAKERTLAPLLYQTIAADLSLREMKKQLSDYGFKVDYLKVFQQRLLVAAYLGKVRLIDNIATSNLQQAA